MSTADDFVGRLRGLVISLEGLLDPADSGLIQHLIDHDEGGEALLTLAWMIVEQNRRVPADALAAIHDLSDGLVDPGDMPPNLNQHVT